MKVATKPVSARHAEAWGKKARNRLEGLRMTRSTLPPEMSSRQVKQEVMEETNRQERNGTFSKK